MTEYQYIKKLNYMKYAILINSCDRFEDCWNPFFKLLSLYWPEVKGNIYLNTEYKDYKYPGLNINSLKVCQKNHFSKSKRAPWSLCLKWALESIPEEVILYMQEDYFIKSKVQNDIIEKYISIIEKDRSIKCIHLTDQSVQIDNESEYPNLYNVLRWQRFRASCQAALWRKTELLEILRTYENAWDFEEFASKRSSLLGHRYLAVNPKWVILNKFEIIPYIFTGIIQGKWYKETVPLFERHKIETDFSIRGIANSYLPRSKYENIKFQIRRNYLKLLNLIEMKKIKNKIRTETMRDL